MGGSDLLFGAQSVVCAGLGSRWLCDVAATANERGLSNCGPERRVLLFRIALQSRMIIDTVLY
jgi:hypothetical protein